MNVMEQAGMALRAASALAITPASLALELEAARGKLQRGLRRLSDLPEEQLEIATVPRDEVYREDMMRLYRCRPVVDAPHPAPILERRYGRIRSYNHSSLRWALYYRCGGTVGCPGSEWRSES